MNNLWTWKEKYKNVMSSLKDNPLLYTFGAAISFLFAAGMVVYWFMVNTELDAKSENLLKTSSYAFNALQADDSLKDTFSLQKTLSDVVGYEKAIDEDIKSTQEQRERLSLPFNNFLHMFYVPTINIWKDPFTDEIDTDLIGKKYIENNPYGDIALIQKWTDFFRDVSVGDSFNTVNDVVIGEATPSPDIVWYFSIPITVTFEAPDKRSFLLLVNKMSMTAYIQNLSLINEFMYYLWETIKEEKSDVLTTLSDGSTVIDEDKEIWHLLYSWIVQGWENKLITSEVIAKAMRKTAWCVSEDDKQCSYLFREKMRALPYLAYGIGRDGIDVVGWFKTFFKNLPPILSIETFSFDEQKNKKSKSGYQGSISFRIYGKDITDEELNNISVKLWGLCYISQAPLDVANAKNKVEKSILNLWKNTINIKRSQSLNQILTVFAKIEGEYPTLIKQKKVVRLFELYRTLKENSLCDVIQSEETITQKNKPLTVDAVLPVVDVSDTLSGEVTTPDPVGDAPIVQETIVEKKAVPVSIDTVGTGNALLWSWSHWSAPHTGSPWVPLPAWEPSRTIGDGNSKRDKTVVNELESIQ